MSQGRALDLLGARVGHYTDTAGLTGCTVLLAPPENVAAGIITGGAPATREFGLLHPQMTVGSVDAVVMTGGSAFGLATADGVQRALRAQGRGFPTRTGPVPIVVGMAIYDLGVGDPDAWPDGACGVAALAAASEAPELGAVGVGTGATMHKHLGRDQARAGGLFASSAAAHGVTCTSFVALNAFGGLADATGPRAVFDPGVLQDLAEPPSERENTTLVTVVTDAALTKHECAIVAEGARDGIARSLDPAHTRFDGDAVVVIAAGGVGAAVDTVRNLAAIAVEQAVRQA